MTKRERSVCIFALEPIVSKAKGWSAEDTLRWLETLADEKLEHLYRSHVGDVIKESTIPGEQHRMKLIETILELSAGPNQPEYNTLIRYSVEELEKILLPLFRAEVDRIEEDADVKLIYDDGRNTVVVDNPERAARIGQSIGFAFEEKERRAAERQRREVAFEKQDWETAELAAKMTRAFSVNKANFGLIRQRLGPGFTLDQVRELVKKIPGSLSPPTTEELELWDTELIKAHQSYLRHDASIIELRRLTREAGAQAQQTPPPDDDLGVMRRRDEALGRTRPMPLDITHQDILKADKAQLKRWIQLYGDAAVTARLREGVAAEQVLNSRQ